MITFFPIVLPSLASIRDRARARINPTYPKLTLETYSLHHHLLEARRAPKQLEYLANKIYFYTEPRLDAPVSSCSLAE